MLLNNFLYKKSILSNQNKIIYDSLSSLIPKSDIYSFEESHLNSGKKKMEIKNRHKNILIPPVFVASVLCEVLWLKSSNFFFLINIF